GDWRRHLATLVANPSPQPGKDQAAMMALGDTLAGAGDIAAGHLCYLIGGGVSAWGQKLHLLGCGQSTEQILATPTCSDALHN
ncbi:hypothetical protein GUF49_08175, partial [Xanthomonas citri pv. citri]|nr:hypothetical protein [Xanthomonas citri pv. citri]